MTGRKWSDIAQYAKWPLCGHRDVNSQWAYKEKVAVICLTVLSLLLPVHTFISTNFNQLCKKTIRICKEKMLWWKMQAFQKDLQSSLPTGLAVVSVFFFHFLSMTKKKTNKLGAHSLFWPKPWHSWLEMTFSSTKEKGTDKEMFCFLYQLPPRSRALSHWKCRSVQEWPCRVLLLLILHQRGHGSSMAPCNKMSASRLLRPRWR